jgi:outer membrane receptor protein involved in Fe transport
MTGGGNDRVFFVDRIPAELIDSVEIIRSPSADVSSEQIAGAANINLKKAGTIKGGWVRGSGFGVEDDELRGAGSVGYGDTIGDTSYLFNFDVQQRRNPKVKSAKVFDYGPGGTIVPRNIQDQNDTRDGTDYALSGEIAQKLGEGVLRLTGFYVLTDREEVEDETRWDVFPNFDRRRVRRLEGQTEDINQQNLSIVGDYRLPVDRDEAQILFGYNLFIDDLNVSEFDKRLNTNIPPRMTRAILGREAIDTTDQDWFGTLAYTANFNSALSVKVGVDGRIRSRDFSQSIEESDTSFPPVNPPYPLPPVLNPFVPQASLGQFDIEENRVDPYVKSKVTLAPNFTLEAGARYEFTDRTISGDGFGSQSDDFGILNPSLHAQYGITDTTTLRFSLARTVLRPSFDQLTPSFLEEQPNDDSAIQGNPNLNQETAWGIDAGFDQKIGDRGVFGFNVFNRNIKDKIELVGTGAVVNGLDVFTYRNVGDARAYGIEVDLEAPLTLLGLENTVVFANYTWMQTEVVDPVTGRTRAFNDQPDYVYNVGFIQSIPEWDSSFGVSYQKRGESTEFGFDEITKLSYDGNLEAFWESRLSKSTVLRFTGANLLDAEKLEEVQVFDPDLNGALIGGEVETEKSGRLFLMTVRQAF